MTNREKTMRSLTVAAFISLDGVIQAPGGSAFTLAHSITTPAGVLISRYERSGEVRTGTFEDVD